MDCCNYAPTYRSSYGFRPDYYENDYGQGGDYYGQHFYQDYYNTQYYPQHWQQANPHFPDYVYNPKEARIRKAMRDANRDRSIGTSPMLARLGERLPSHPEWAQTHEDPLMMNPINEMRHMDYPMPNSENHYIPPMDSYNKMNTTSMVPNYMQPSPLAQLQQQQSEMWHPYQKNLQSRSLGTQFHRPMIQGMQQPQYMPAEPVQDNATNLIMDKPQGSPSACMPQMHTDPGAPIVQENNTMTSSIPCCGTPERPKSTQGNQQHYLEAGAPPDCLQTPLVESKMSQRDQYMHGSEAVGGHKNFEVGPKVEATAVTKKPRGRPPSKNKVAAAPPLVPAAKPLPDFNEAFGSTERGRFLSPPDPRLSKSYFDVVFDNDGYVKFDDF